MVIEEYLDYLKKEDQNYTNTKCLYIYLVIDLSY